MGGFLYTVLIIFEAILSALLIVIIFMQKTKGGMGGAAFGGSAGEAIFGSRMGNVLTKATVVLGTIFLVNTLLLTIMTARRSGVSRSIMDQVIPPVSAPAQPMAFPEQGTQPPMPPAQPWGTPDDMPSDPPIMVDPQQPVEIPAPAEQSTPDLDDVALPSETLLDD